MSAKRYIRRAGSVLAGGLGAFAITFASFCAAFWIPSDHASDTTFALVFFVFLIGPLLLGPGYGAFLAIRRRNLALGLAVIVGVLLSAIVFYAAIIYPAFDQMD